MCGHVVVVDDDVVKLLVATERSELVTIPDFARDLRVGSAGSGFSAKSRFERADWHSDRQLG